MQDSVDCLVRELESYRGTDRIIRTLCYGSQFVGGILSCKTDGSSPNLGKSLLLLSAQLNHCRTVLRLFDDLPMLVYTHTYGFGAKEEDGAVRWISVLENVADQLYYPCEHVAWAADAHLIQAKSDPWWHLSNALWGTSLLLGILRSLRLLLLLRRKRRCELDGSRDRELRRRMQSELLSIVGNMTDLSNAVHWMPHGFLWAGRFPTWLVGLMGTISSVTMWIQRNVEDRNQSCSA
ncbi:peroxisomal membrane protein 11C [Entelurus aequoreus]|uniref:peroxisomal membrane protein 11C n=1 Tax=Entelurus aequoreus TaxID=161455 RepID=UPI002B1E5687|nr:peroxisomal membrane protein 11C [Entelurus aequoreus]